MSAMENLLDGNWWDDSTDNGQDEDLDWSLQQAYPTEWPSQPWRDEEAARDFPNAMDPHSWYRNPPMDEGTPRPFSQTRLGSLPREVLQVIWIMLAGSDYGHYCEITNEDGQYERPRSGPEYLRLHDCGYLLIGMSRELGVCQEMRGALMDGIMRSTMYRCWDYHRLPETISDLRFSGHLHLIQNMTLDLSKLSNWGSAKRFPEILGLICGEMPGLEHFIIHTKHDDSKPAYVEAESGDPESSLVTRSQQETRLLLQLAAFFVLRHPNLDVMTTEHPVEPETWEQTHNRCTTVQLFSRRLHENVIRDVARSKPLDATNEAEPKVSTLPILTSHRHVFPKLTFENRHTS